MFLYITAQTIVQLIMMMRTKKGEISFAIFIINDLLPKMLIIKVCSKYISKLISPKKWRTLFPSKARENFVSVRKDAVIIMLAGSIIMARLKFAGIVCFIAKQTTRSAKDVI